MAKSTGRWTEVEVKALYEYYPQFGGVYLEENNIVNRGAKAISAKAASLGIKFSNLTKSEEPVVPWSSEELDILRIEYPSRGPDALFKTGLLKGRTEKSIRIKASREGIEFFNNDGADKSTLYLLLVELTDKSKFIKVGITTRDVTFRKSGLIYDIGRELVQQCNVIYEYCAVGSDIRSLEKAILDSKRIEKFIPEHSFLGSGELITINSLKAVLDIIDLETV